MSPPLLQRLGENSSSLGVQIVFAGPVGWVVGVLGNATWTAIQTWALKQPVDWWNVFANAGYVAFWTTLGALAAVFVLRWLRGEGRKVEVIKEREAAEAQASKERDELEARHLRWPPGNSFYFIAEKCVLHADGRFVVAFVCMNKSELTWHIRRSVLTDLRTGRGSKLSGDVEDHSIHQNAAATLKPGGLVRTVFRGKVEVKDPAEWQVGNVVDLHMGHGGMPQSPHASAGHVVVYGESIKVDETVPFRALDEMPLFILHGKVQPA